MALVTELTELSATQLARLIATRELSALDVCAAHIARCEQTQRSLNALVWTRFDDARREATAIDERIARGESVGPLAGVPVTVKECFFFAGSPACVGLSKLKSERSAETGILVKRLVSADAILLGKTNVPQLMMWHECDNPVYGRTNNPWDLNRTPGGSTGGEAALIAAGGSALGLGNDLGGSIRVPAHFCGIHGLLPTRGRLTNRGEFDNFGWLSAMRSSPGPLARSVDDLSLAMSLLVPPSATPDPDAEATSWPDPRAVHVDQLRIGIFLGHERVSTSPAILRGLSSAAESLRQQGALVQPITAPDAAEALEIYGGLIQADGAAHLTELAQGSKLDWRLDRILTVGRLGHSARRAVSLALGAMGQRQMADLIGYGGRKSDAEFNRLKARQAELEARLVRQLEDAQLDALLTPPFALPAPRHGQPIDLLPAASYTFLPNLLGWPAGVVSLTTVRDEEQRGRPSSLDLVQRQAAAVDADSAGLPVGVQVIARPWREDIVLAVMATIERALPRPKLPAAQVKAMGAAT